MFSFTTISIFFLVLVVAAYIPLVLVILRRDRIRLARRRPVNEVLADAVAHGRISEERFGEMMDEVHASMPSLDAPYPLVREWTEHRL